MKLHVRLFIGLVLGVMLGAVLHPYADSASVSAINANLLRPIGQIFLRSIFMIVVPMVFSALVNLLQQGAGLELQAALPAASLVEQLRENAAAVKPLGDTLVELIPRNPI